MSIGRRFHHQTSCNATGFKGSNISRGKDVPPYKVYSGAKRIALPEPSSRGMAVEDAIEKRKSDRSFLDRPLTLEELSRILHSAYGITHSWKGAGLRAVPSGGALYPVEIYVVASGVESLAEGFYHFQVPDNCLEQIREGDFREELFAAVFKQDSVAQSPVNVILTARFDRMTREYSDRGYRYVYMEIGAISENIHLQTISLKMGTVMIGAFNDDAVNRMLDIDGLDEAALIIMPIGFPKQE